MSEEQAIQRALDQGLLSAADLAECLTEQSRLLAQGEQRSLEDLLAERGCLERRTWRALLGSRRVSLGEQVGPYRLQEVLGRGSMGIVYLATDPAGGEVALKLLNAERALAGGERERFLREVRASLALEHPRIVATRDHGEDRGVPWLAMERVVGRSLRAVLAEGPLPPRRAAAVALDVAEALDYAHGRGVVHRDVKPDNVLVREGEGRALLGDFGLARRRGEGTLTQEGRVVGTPLYMAPEQARGDEVDPRADVYGLGATLYESLTRATPFDSESEVDTDAILARVAHQRPPTLARAAPAVPPALAAIVDQALAPHPDDRYPSAGALARDLRRFLRGERVEARPPGRARRARRWVARRSRTLAGAALVVALLGAGGGSLALLSRRWRADEALLRARAAQALGEAERSRRELAAALELWPGLSEAHRLRGELALARGEREEAEAAYSRVLAAEPAHVGALVGRARARLARDAAGALADLERARAHAGAADPRPWLEGGLALYELGRGEEALEWLRAGLRRPGASSERRLLALVRCGELERAQRDLGAAQAALEEALALAPEHGEASLLLAEVAWERGDLGRSESLCARLIARDARAPEPRLLRARARRARGRWREALADLRGLSGLPRARLLRGLLRLEHLPQGGEGALSFDLEGARVDLSAASRAALSGAEGALAELGLAYACWLGGAQRESQAALERAARAAPEASGPRLLRARLALDRGDAAGAREALTGLRAGPARLGLAEAALVEGDLARAREGCARLADPAAAALRARLAWLAEEPGVAAREREAYRGAAPPAAQLSLESDPWTLARAAAAAGDRELEVAAEEPTRFRRGLRRALACYERARRLWPQEPHALARRAGTLLLLGEAEAAAGAFLEAYGADPQLSAALVERASLQRALLRGAGPEAALETLALLGDRGGASAARERCRALLALGRRADALRALGPLDPLEPCPTAALRVRAGGAGPRHARAALLRAGSASAERGAVFRHALAGLSFRAGLLPEGQHLLERALEEDPRSAWLWQQRARLLSLAGEAAWGAFQARALAAELAPDAEDEFLAALPAALRAERRGEPHPGQPCAERLLALASGGGDSHAPIGDPPSWLSLALDAGLALRRGRLERAAARLDQAASLAPASVLVRALRAALAARAGDERAASEAVRALPRDPGLRTLIAASPELAPLPLVQEWLGLAEPR